MNLWVKNGKGQPMSEEQLRKYLEDAQKPQEEDADAPRENQAAPITVCKSCVFAEYEEVSDKVFQQTGCALGRLEKFEEKGTQLLLVEEPDLDEDKNELDTKKQFAVIDGRICTTLREQPWVNEQHKKADKKEGEGFTLQELMALAKHEVTMQRNTTLIVYIPQESEWEDVHNYVEWLKDFEKPFNHVLFMNTSRKLLPITFVHNMQHEFKNLPFTWQMEFVLEGTHKLIEKSLLHQCIDMAVKKTQTVYYLFTDIYHQVEPYYMERIDKAINEELDRFLIIHTEDEQGLFSQTRLHKMVGGFNKGSYIDKLTRIAESQECPSLVRTFQSLPS